MSPLLDLNAAGHASAHMKLGWAKHHIRSLDNAASALLKGKPYRVFTKDDVEAGEHIVGVDPEPPTIDIMLMAGDVISCLRASLDHLAYALTRIPGGTPNDRSSFPIIGVQNSDGRKSFQKAVIGIPSLAVNVIDSVQPYQAGNLYRDTKLWRLNRLWNVDKHRRIPTHAHGIDVRVNYPAGMDPIAGGPGNQNVWRFPIAAKGQIYFDPSSKVRIEFGDASEGVVIPLEELDGIYKLIGEEILPKFKGFFEP